jgi:hypothetical protein
MSANKPKLHLVDEEIVSHTTPSFPNRPIDQAEEGDTSEKIHNSHTPDEIQALRDEIKFFDGILASIDQKTDAELYGYLKKFDGSCLDGNLVGDPYSNSPHPRVKKRESDGRLVYHDPKNLEHHEQLLIVRLIELINSRRRHYNEFLRGIGREP